MKKYNIFLLSGLLLLLIIAGVLFFTQYELNRVSEDGKSKLKIERKQSTLEVLRDFAVEDTASVDEIFLADKANNTILLERQAKDKWMVNGKYTARKDFMNILLETIHRIEIANPVPKAKQDFVLRNLSGSGIKCEIYQDGNLSKTYYVGGVTQDNLGTFMLMENSSAVFEVYLPGFNGFLTTRYNTSIKEWRNKLVFSYRLENIHEVRIEYPSEPEESFIAVREGSNQYYLKNAESGESTARFDTVGVKMLMARFKKVGLEYYLPENKQKHYLDSLSQLEPIRIFAVTDQDGNTKKVECYHRPNINKNLDESGEPFKNDIDRLYGVSGREVFVMQYYTVDPLSVKLSDLTLAEADD